MFDLLWLVPALPLGGFLVLALAGRRLPWPAVAAVGVGSVALSALVMFAIAIAFVADAPEGDAFTQTLWTWIAVGDFVPAISLRLDALSIVMALVITGVGALIHLYSTEYMQGDDGYARFFASMNLFVAAMLTLVLADNLLLLLLGWEGVGLCSFLLIGFWYREPANVHAARKAFIVTRVGDTGFLIGLLLLFTQLGTLEIQPLMQRAEAEWETGEGIALLAAALLLAGAVGKSAQLPLQVWLPDAMAGPTPVSALIHAATMVTAGVYLIARTHVLFELAPEVQTAVAIIGVVTLLLAGFSALTQREIKRVLAYSTISQIGFMFLALGVGAWGAAIFHFMTHAFFKALLFLGAGSVIHALDEENDIFRMGGLRRLMPLTFWTFLIGAASLAAVPLITAGFYSKDLILIGTWGSEDGNVTLWALGVFGALITGIYTFRLVFVAFFGDPHTPVSHPPGWRMQLPLVVLAALALAGGFVELPATLGGFHAFSDFIERALPGTAAEVGIGEEAVLQTAAAVAALGGIAVAYVFFIARPAWQASITQGAGDGLRRFWAAGWGFDWLYERLFLRPYVWFARTNRRDVLDAVYVALASLARRVYGDLSATQAGLVRLYAAGIAVGAVGVLALVVLL